MKILLFGATGTAGSGVLRAALAHPRVEEVRALARRAPATDSPKLRFVEHRDFLDYGAVADAFAGLDALLFCLGISISQVEGEAEYRRITRDFALAAAATLAARSPDAAFHYLSGRGARADSRFVWARVKAEAEADLRQRVRAVVWRPGAIDGERSASSPWIYDLARPLFRLLRPLRDLYVRSDDLGRAMLLAVEEGLRDRVIENRAIRDLADRARSAAAGRPARGA